MPYPETKIIFCPNCHQQFDIRLVDLQEKLICPFCEHVILLRFENGGFNEPDPRHLC